MWVYLPLSSVDLCLLGGAASGAKLQQTNELIAGGAPQCYNSVRVSFRCTDFHSYLLLVTRSDDFLTAATMSSFSQKYTDLSKTKRVDLTNHVLK